MHSSDGGELRTFEIAGHDGLFVPAEAQIIDGKTVKIWSNQIQNPRFVRYGWQPFTRANLVNEAGLPASTFRSEASPVSWFRLPDLPGTEKVRYQAYLLRLRVSVADTCSWQADVTSPTNQRPKGVLKNTTAIYMH